MGRCSRQRRSEVRTPAATGPAYRVLSETSERPLDRRRVCDADGGLVIEQGPTVAEARTQRDRCAGGLGHDPMAFPGRSAGATAGLSRYTAGPGGIRRRRPLSRQWLETMIGGLRTPQTRENRNTAIVGITIGSSGPACDSALTGGIPDGRPQAAGSSGARDQDDQHQEGDARGIQPGRAAVEGEARGPGEAGGGGQKNARLSSQIDKSYGQVQDIAVKAIEGSGNLRVLPALQARAEEDQGGQGEREEKS